MMAIGERIHFFRILRGMTQKYLGTIGQCQQFSLTDTAPVEHFKSVKGNRNKKTEGGTYCCIGTGT